MQSVRTSYHTHNEYCDGEGTIQDVIEAAIAAGLTTIGISSHAPLPFPTKWTMALDRWPKYVREVRDLQERYRDRINVLLGSEIDYIPHPEVVAFQEEMVHPAGVQYYVGSVHFLGDSYPPREIDSNEEQFRDILRDEYDGDIRAMANDYYRRMRDMLQMPRVRIAGHLDLIKRWNENRTYFSGDEVWYRSAVDDTLLEIAAAGTIVEFNTAGWRKPGVGDAYPAPWILQRCRDLDIPVTIDSDAHIPSDVNRDFDRGLTRVTELGITPASL